MATYGWYDLVGNVGVVVIVGTYLLLQLGRLNGSGFAYSMLNATGASMVIVSLMFNFNLSAFVVELFWVLISLLGVARNVARANRPS
jgi:hypothetical protein